MEVPFVDLKAQYRLIAQEIDRAISDVISKTAFIGGYFTKEFEKAFCHYLGVSHCVGVGNGTDALYIALRSLGVGQGDEVITVANSFVATSEAITMTGAKVIFVDCDPVFYNIDLKKVENAITSKTKAIIPVHLYGMPVDMPTLMEIARKYELIVVEDAAQAHGARIGERKVGTWGHAACFSFYPGKNLGAYGDAGAIVTNDEALAVYARMLANHGRVEKYDHEFEGVNSRMDGIQAAVLSVKLKYLDEWNEKRRLNAKCYTEQLKSTGIIVPKEDDSIYNVYHLYVIRVGNRDEVREHLKRKGISTGIHYPVALPNLTAYKYLGHRPEDFPIATRFSKQILSLPMYPELGEDQLNYVCEELKKVAIPIEEEL
ncbi:erythromycin biosynthesis sensory transduction protein eryC1 [Candidatus Woesearchaeota archaeon]|nr:MAG: erythromycin biosynthesis sensory transduction protein eryC1 [Candidatus Woesearchaeota archaeon]